MRQKPVLLIASPTDLIGMPAIGVSVLKAQLAQNDIECEVLYLNAIFEEIFGAGNLHELFVGNMNDLIWEKLFASFAHGEPEKREAGALTKQELSKHYDFYKLFCNPDKKASVEILLAGREACKNLLNNIEVKLKDLKPKIVGFSNSFIATNAAIAIGKTVKKVLPECLYVVGGNNCEGPMGKELARSATSIDYVFQGEAEFVFAEFCKNYLAKEKLPKNKVVVCPLVNDLNAIPVPDYSDYFKQNGNKGGYVCLSFETSRGCWWGQKNRCKFCGETPNLYYRTKDPGIAIKELVELKNRHPDVRHYCASDAILPQSYYKTFLPMLAKQDLDNEIIYEIKSKLNKRNAVKLKRAGVNRILAGIESLSTRLLGLLGKGTDAFDNLRLLRNCKEAGIFVSWTNLIGIPNDKIDDYKLQEKIIPFIEHFSPPNVGSIRIQRFSPYFEEPMKYGIKNIRPFDAYFECFPETYDLNNLANYFNADYLSESIEYPSKIKHFVENMKKWISMWFEKGKPPVLEMRKLGSNLWEITDTRNCANVYQQSIDDQEYHILNKCRVARDLDTIGMGKIVRRLLGYGYLVKIDKKIISIVCQK